MALPLAQDPAQPFTFDDLDTMPHDGRRWELIAGSLVVSPAPFGAHQLAARRVTDALVAAETPGTLVLPAPYDWRVDSTGESFQPDIIVIRATDFDPAGPLRATPLLVVEVVSPRREDQDRILKHARYEALGVPAYWIVSPAVPSLAEFRLTRGGRYEERAVVTGKATFTTDYPFSIELIPAALTWQR